MKVILVTGIDGSGKSTLLNRVRTAISRPDNAIIQVPEINTTPLENDPELYKAALFVNQLSHEADLLKIPQLKAVALLASMLLFEKLLQISEAGGLKAVICERHPLIDTGIYALFYAEKMAPQYMDTTQLKKLDEKYSDELNYIIGLFPEGLIDQPAAGVEVLTNFIYDWFHLQKRLTTEDLKQLFPVSLPDQIYFLQAPADFLFNRIKDRKVLEAHESEEVFHLLNQAYEQLFNQLSASHATDVKIINASNQERMDTLFQELVLCQVSNTR